jgi:hypothetical protein
MSKRKYPGKRQELLNYLAVRDGGMCCLLCHSTDDLTIDHTDNNPDNNDPANLHILCRSCNTAERNRRKSGGRRLNTETAPKYVIFLRDSLANKSQVTSVCVREKPDGTTAPAPRARSPWAFGTSEEANRVMEPAYRLWVIETVTRQGRISKADAIHAGAEYLQKRVGRGSPATTERYFRKMISATGCLQQGRGLNGETEWVFRSDLNLEEVERNLREEAAL